MTVAEAAVGLLLALLGAVVGLFLLGALAVSGREADGERGFPSGRDER